MNPNCPSYIDETCGGIYSHDRNLLLDAHIDTYLSKKCSVIYHAEPFRKVEKKIYYNLNIFDTVISVEETKNQ